MALDELHARRLATVVSLIEGALDRMELTLRGIESNGESGSSPVTAAEIHQIREEMNSVRKHLELTVERFSVRLKKPEAQQVLAAELSTLWVVLENALPDRLRGYGREFAPEDRSDWEKSIHALLRGVDQIRTAVLRKKPSRS